MRILVSHFGLARGERRSAVPKMVETVKNGSAPVIVCGDFNATPGAPELMPLYDCLRDTATLASGRLLTFPSHAPVRKIDYIFVSPDVEVIQAFVPETTASDHCPYVARLAL